MMLESIEKRLTDALAPLGWDIANAVYKGSSDRYLILRHSDHPISHGDDRPGALRILVYVDIFCPLDFNPLQAVSAVKRALFAAGCTYPTTEDASDDDCRHIVVESEAIGSPELEEPEQTGTASEAAPAQEAVPETGTDTSAEVRSRWG